METYQKVQGKPEKLLPFNGSVEPKKRTKSDDTDSAGFSPCDPDSSATPRPDEGKQNSRFLMDIIHSWVS